MNNTQTASETPAAGNRDEIMSALFAGMVIQQTNMALILLGKMAHPETGQTTQDIESARMFIDQLEMLEAKTKGNLTKDEDRLLKQSLTTLRMAFVESVDNQTGRPPEGPSAPAGESAKAPDAGNPSAAPASEDDSRKKFSKRY